MSASTVDSPLKATPLVERIQSLVSGVSFRELGLLLGMKHETVRRQVSGMRSPSLEFVRQLADAFEVSYRWLLTGQGEKYQADERAAVLEGASPSELMAEFASRFAPCGEHGVESQQPIGARTSAARRPVSRPRRWRRRRTTARR